MRNHASTCTDALNAALEKSLHHAWGHDAQLPLYVLSPVLLHILAALKDVPARRAAALAPEQIHLMQLSNMFLRHAGLRHHLNEHTSNNPCNRFHGGLFWY